MLKKILIILLFTNLFLWMPSYGGESGDENKNISDDFYKKNLNLDEDKIVKIEKKEKVSTDVKILKKIKNNQDPFNKNLPLLIANRGLYSNADFYPLESLSLIGILNSEKISGNNVAIFEMPDQRQIVASVGQVIGKEKAIIQAINNTDILLSVNNQNIKMILSQ